MKNVHAPCGAPNNQNVRIPWDRTTQQIEYCKHIKTDLDNPGANGEIKNAFFTVALASHQDRVRASRKYPCRDLREIVKVEERCRSKRLELALARASRPLRTPYARSNII
ncbi:hypothetical protein Trydic_g20982 [Trypoxylus dichotomus]